MQTYKSWMRKGTKSKYDNSLFLFSFMTYGFAWISFVIFTLRSFSHSWLIGLHGLVLSYSLFVPFLIQTYKSWMRKEMKSKYDKTKPYKAISHEWEKKRRVNSFVIFTLRSFSHSWLIGLHGLVLSYSLFVSFLIHDSWVCMV
jgi:hypothetical protein